MGRNKRLIVFPCGYKHFACCDKLPLGSPLQLPIMNQHQEPRLTGKKSVLLICKATILFLTKSLCSKLSSLLFHLEWNWSNKKGELWAKSIWVNFIVVCYVILLLHSQLQEKLALAISTGNHKAISFPWTSLNFNFKKWCCITGQLSWGEGGKALMLDPSPISRQSVVVWGCLDLSH